MGGYQYMRLPPEPALDSMKLKANRLINTSGEGDGSRWQHPTAASRGRLQMRALAAALMRICKPLQGFGL